MHKKYKPPYRKSGLQKHQEQKIRTRERILRKIEKDPAYSPFPYNSQQNMRTHVNLYFQLGYEVYKKIMKSGCAKCGSMYNLHLHHIIPKSQGGGNDMGNLIPLCLNCHLKTHNKTTFYNQETKHCLTPERVSVASR